MSAPSPRPTRSATFDRPVKATLHVHLDNGENWEATDDDLAKFGLTSKLDAYMRFDDTLRKTLHAAGLIRRDVTEAQVNPLRYLAEITISHPDLIDHPDHEEWSSVVHVERALSVLVARVSALAPLPWRFVNSDDEFDGQVVDAAGDEVSLTNLVNLSALVAIVNAAAPLVEDDRG